MFWYARRDQISRLAALAALVILLSPLLKYHPAQRPKPAETFVAVQLLEYAEPIETPTPQPAVVPPRPLVDHRVARSAALIAYRRLKPNAA